MIIKTRKQILSSMIRESRNNNSNLTDFNQGSVIRSIYNAIAAILAQLYYSLYKLYRSARIIYASGTDLEIAVAPRSITRRGTTKAAKVVTFTGANGTVIPSGMKLATPDGIEFLTTEGDTVPGNGTVDVNIEAVVGGDVGNVNAGEITVMVDDIDGLTAVTNAAPTDGGFSAETDEQLRNRAVTQLATLSQGIEASYEAWALEARSDVIRAKPQYGHASYSGKSIVVHLIKDNAGIFTTSDLDQIANYIQIKAPLGIVIVCLNVEWANIDLVAQVRRASGFNLVTVKENISVNLRLYLDYREWEWGTDLDWSDLFALVSETLGVEEVVLSGFSPSSNVTVSDYSLPKFISLTVTDW